MLAFFDGPIITYVHSTYFELWERTYLSSSRPEWPDCHQIIAIWLIFDIYGNKTFAQLY